MDVTKIPFNDFIGLTFSDDNRYLLMLENRPEYLNHLSTVHASTMFALAEATGGHYLLNEFQELTGIVPVVRKVEVKYRKPASGKLYSSAQLVETSHEEVLASLENKKRASLKVEVKIFDEQGVNVISAVFEWFVTFI